MTSSTTPCLGKGSRHEHRRKILAAGIAANYGAPAGQSVGLNHHGRTAGAVAGVGPDPKLVERLQQGLNGTLVHALDAVHVIRAVSQRQEGSEKTGGCPGSAYEQISLICGNAAAGALHSEGCCGFVLLNGNAHRAQCSRHVVGIVD